jgi:hypothetical protein
LLDHSRASFTLAAYDNRQPLIIDPTINFQAYLGGSDFENVSAIALYGDGNAFVTGLTLSTDFPTVGELQSFQRNSDAFVAELASSGQIVFSTYLGGYEED